MFPTTPFGDRRDGLAKSRGRVADNPDRISTLGRALSLAAVGLGAVALRSCRIINPWHLSPVRSSDLMKSSRRSAREVWARFTGLAIPDWAARLRSRRPLSASASALNGKHVLSHP